jgi:hypothetical protein
MTHLQFYLFFLKIENKLGGKQRLFFIFARLPQEFSYQLHILENNKKSASS